MDKPKMILSLPSSGSDWFANCVCQATGWKYYVKEWFNPLTNLPMADALIDALLGCELASTTPYILGQFPQGTERDRVARLREKLFGKYVSQGWQLDKEVWAFGRAYWFAEHFDCMVLARTKKNVFPASRLRVLQWYESIGVAATQHAPYGQPRIHDRGFLDRVRIGFDTALSRLINAAAAYKLPVVWWDDLGAEDSATRNGLSSAREWIGDSDTYNRLCQVVCETYQSKCTPKGPYTVSVDDLGGLYIEDRGTGSGTELLEKKLDSMVPNQGEGT